MTPPTEDTLDRYDATRLFVERAGAALPGLVITDPTAATIGRICSGIPLAIELAAARLSVLSLAQINQRLQDRFHLLSEENRTDQARQQTLRATVDWSVALLSEKEQALFRRLAVFSGGWTLEAAEAVGSGEGITPEDVLNLLASLVDKSLVVADELGESKRYRLLETPRQYGWEQLRTLGEEAAVRKRHRDYFLTLAETADVKLGSAEQVDWLDRLEREHDNLRAVLAWCLAEGRDYDTGLRLAGALAWFWRLGGHMSEGRRWLAIALAAPERERAASRPRALDGAGFLAEAQGDAAAATALFAESIRLARDLGNETEEAWAVHGMGRVALLTGDFDRAQALFKESLALFVDRGDYSACARTLHYLADIPRERGDLSRAAEIDQQAITFAREAGDTQIQGWILAHLGNVVFLLGDTERAEALYREGLSIVSKLRDPWGIAVCLMGLTGLAGARGHAERAAKLFGMQQALRTKIGTTAPPTGPSAFQHGVDAARATLGSARFEAVAAEGHRMTLEQALAYAFADGETPPLPSIANASSKAPSVGGLTAREQEVAVLVAEGYSNRAIADALVIAPRTVETHVSNILAKLALHSRAQIAAWSVEHGLVAPHRNYSPNRQTT